MRPDRQWIFLFILFLIGMLLIYSLSPFWGLFLFFFQQGINLILAMPQIVLWLIGGTVLAYWAFHLFLKLAKSMFPGIPKPQSVQRIQGNLGELRRSIHEVDPGTYSQGRIRQLLSSLAIDLISIRLDISEEESRKIFFAAEWTEDDILKSYFYDKKSTTSKNKWSFPRFFKKFESSSLLDETGQVLDRLNYYGDLENGGKFGHRDGND